MIVKREFVLSTMNKIKPTKLIKGFTLIELLVVISIIGLLSAVVLASLGQAKDKAMSAKVVSEMKALQNAIEMYKVDNKGKVPADSSGMSGLQGPLVGGGYISKIPSVSNNIGFLEYKTSYAGKDIDELVYCGTKEVDNYIIIFWQNGRFPLSLPHYGSLENGISMFKFDESYCVSD